MLRWLEPRVTLNKVSLKKVTLEHIMPQSTKYSKLISNLGNYALLTKFDNNKIGSDRFKKRKDTYKNSEFSLTSGKNKYNVKGIHRYKQWDDTSIKKREKDIARLLYKLNK